LTRSACKGLYLNNHLEAYSSHKLTNDISVIASANLYLFLFLIMFSNYT
jgi:hypothetical protein